MGPQANGLSVREELPAAPSSVAAARRIVRRFAGDLDVDVDAVELAVSEAVANAVVHAYEDDGVVEVKAAAAPYELRVVISDRGRGLAAGGENGGAGFGLKIIRRLARHVEVADSPRGVTLTMTFPLGGRWASG